VAQLILPAQLWTLRALRGSLCFLIFKSLALFLTKWRPIKTKVGRARVRITAESYVIQRRANVWNQNEGVDLGLDLEGGFLLCWYELDCLTLKNPSWGWPMCIRILMCNDVRSDAADFL
jgi:hypothetical protein